jgi:O-antigen/teichoic acid export membrane protein
MHEQRLGEWMKVSLPIFLVEGFFFLLINIDVLMVGHALDPEQVAIYFAATKIMALAHFVYFAVKASVAQRYSDLLHSGNRAEFASFAEASVRWTFWPTLFLGIVILLMGLPASAAFRSGLHRRLSASVHPHHRGDRTRQRRPGGKPSQYVGQAEYVRALLYAATLAVNVILNLVLIPRFGLTGAAVSTAIAMLMEAALLSSAVSRTLHITMFILIPRDRAKTSEGAS